LTKKGAGYKPNSVPWWSWSFNWDDGHPPPRAAYPETLGGQPSNISLFGLAPDGVYPAFRVTTKAVSSYLPVSPLPGSPGGLFSVALSAGRPTFVLRTILPCGVRTFLPDWKSRSDHAPAPAL